MKIKQVQKELLKQLEVESKELVKIYDQTTATWKGDKPIFQEIGTVTATAAFASVKVDRRTKGGKKWTWLDEGTKPHRITAKKAKTLSFRQGGFRAKTSPGRLRSRGGSPATGPRVFPLSVRHPGTKARKWTPLIQKKRQKPFQRNMQRANNRAIRNIY